jgi:hypothetical protein
MGSFWGVPGDGTADGCLCSFRVPSELAPNDGGAAVVAALFAMSACFLHVETGCLQIVSCLFQKVATVTTDMG